MNDVKWDLSQLVKSTDQALILKELDALVEEAGTRAEQYRTNQEPGRQGVARPLR